MENVKFDDVPRIISEILVKLDNLERLLLQNNGLEEQQENSTLSVEAAAEFLNIAVSTLYGKVCRREVPVCKKGKKLYFDKDDLRRWIKSGKKKTVQEITDSKSPFSSKRKF